MRSRVTWSPAILCACTPSNKVNEYLDELDLRNLAVAIEVDILEGLSNLFWGLVDVFHLRRPGVVPDRAGSC
jgi:hypothetical protein